MTDPDMDEWTEPLRCWVEAPWWSRWWQRLRWRLWWPGRLRRLVFMALNQSDDRRRDLEDCQRWRSRYGDCLDELAGRLQGLASMTRELVRPDMQERFAATMHDAIDLLNETVMMGAYAKPQVSTDANPLQCICCKRTQDGTMRFMQHSAGVECFDCLGIKDAPPQAPDRWSGRDAGETS